MDIGNYHDNYGSVGVTYVARIATAVTAKSLGWISSPAFISTRIRTCTIVQRARMRLRSATNTRGGHGHHTIAKGASASMTPFVPSSTSIHDTTAPGLGFRACGVC